MKKGETEDACVLYNKIAESQYCKSINHIAIHFPEIADFDRYSNTRQTKMYYKRISILSLALQTYKWKDNAIAIIAFAYHSYVHHANISLRRFLTLKIIFHTNLLVLLG